MRVVDAVRRAIEEEADDCWYVYLRSGVPHHWHLTTTCAVDGFDSRIFRQLTREGICLRAGLTHVERSDGSSQPWLLIHDERRVQEESRIGGRRITDPQEMQ